MRSLVLAVSLSIAGASVVHAQQAQSLQPAQSPTSTLDFVPQQVVAPDAAQAANLQPAEAPIGMTRAQAGIDATQSSVMAEPASAAVEPSTRNILAIIGAVVVVIALVSLLL